MVFFPQATTTTSPTTVTAQMAQEVIKQALLNQNLAPSIHSKLVAFQKKQQEKKEKLASPPPPPPPSDTAASAIERETKVGIKKLSLIELLRTDV